MARIFISTTSFAKEDPAPLEYCKKGNKVTLNPYGRKLTAEELIHLASEAEGIIAGTEVFNRALLENLPKLRVISRCGVGLDSLDLEAAEELSIKVYNTPDAPTLAVAELTLGLMFDLLRKITFMDRKLKSGLWEKRMGSLLNGKKIGIIGFGRIGKKVAELLIPFAVETAYYDINRQQGILSCNYKALRDLFIWSDIITVHCSVTEDRREVIGRDELKMMKKGAYLINLSRGGIINEDALYNVLEEGHLAGAALDVFEDEPYKGKLAELDNVILTPHIGSSAKEARIEMEKQAVDNLLKGLEVIK